MEEAMNPTEPTVDVDVQEIVNILTQRIAQLELSNAAQQAHISALLAKLVVLQPVQPDPEESAEPLPLEGADLYRVMMEEGFSDEKAREEAWPQPELVPDITETDLSLE